VFDLSLSCDLEMSRSWCIMGFVNIDRSYDVSPLSILVVMNWIFSLQSFVIVGLNIQIWEHMMYVLHNEYSRWQWGIILIHLMYVMAINLRIPEVTLG
jgi:hypothetical protein